MYDIEPIEHPIDPRLESVESAAARKHRSVTVMRRLVDGGRLTRYEINGRCVLIDSREVDVLDLGRRKR